MEAEIFPTVFQTHRGKNSHSQNVWLWPMEKKLLSSHLFELLNLGLFKHAEHIGAALHRLLLHLLWCLMADIKKCKLKYHDYPFDLSSLLLFWKIVIYLALTCKILVLKSLRVAISNHIRLLREERGT